MEVGRLDAPKDVMYYACERIFIFARYFRVNHIVKNVPISPGITQVTICNAPNPLNRVRPPKAKNAVYAPIPEAIV